MGYSVKDTPVFSEKFAAALSYRLIYSGKQSASRLVSSLESRKESLSLFPIMGTELGIDEKQSGSLRWLLLDNYILVYRVIDEDETVLLVNLFVGGEDWKSKLGVRENETTSDEE